MLVKRAFSLRQVAQFSGHHIVWLALLASAVALPPYFGWFDWISVPWFPITVVGTAVAFYVGFKNNSAYDRMWEARKIWGAIINSSRSWGASVKGFVGNQFANPPYSDQEIHAIWQRLLYRHIGWLYALRSQLLMPTSWEHANQKGVIGTYARFYQKEFGVGLVDDQVTPEELRKFLPANEYERLINYKNTATQIIDQQSQELAKLREADLIDDFRHMALQNLLKEFYDHQGKCERIKKFPLPRQYASMSRVFVGIFIFLLPFGMVTELGKMGDIGYLLAIPLTVLVGWLYVVMEIVGDYSENPFQGMSHDIPMLSLTRVIEIDLREMLGEKDIPPAIEARKGVLM
ncbi:bestrophin family ion channel [Pontibacter sp. G13]|uniref:bestrophin family protein n=1 Tax=Pontibacter sp. G13 TaxID=3074898 RepID=UPI00288B1CE9|nr:bestrophin family ion channel [Pontibacter sp. G13]WNJ18190.1 bestrophin family ion channel [Pontibacter sp. G13]